MARQTNQNQPKTGNSGTFFYLRNKLTFQKYFLPAEMVHSANMGNAVDSNN